MSWALSANALATLGDNFATGGIGPDAMHAISVVGAIATWIAIACIFRVRMRHWFLALLCGITLSAALVESGLRDLAAAGIWSVACDAGNGQACHQLGDFYADGRSSMHGWLDAQPLHARACAAGVAASCFAAARPTSPIATADACSVLRDLDACESLLNSGIPSLRLAACETLEPACRISSSMNCRVTLRRCERATSPHAGVD